jgi:nucleotide-binding universal stress UspA family protein
MIRSIAHPTDFSAEGTAAFELALRLALANRCRLDLLHVHHPAEEAKEQGFPQIRATLQRWGCLEPGAEIEDIASKTGVHVRKVEIYDANPSDGLAKFLQSHGPDLIVMATHGAAGINRWLKGSVSADVVRETLVPTLVLGPAARPVVDSATGTLDVATVLVPVDRDPAPDGAIDRLEALTSTLGVTLDILHVGPCAPTVRTPQGGCRTVRTLDGPVVETLLGAAQHSSLMAMPTAGRHSFLDAIQGSTTERVVSQASCPVLVLPVPA